MGRKRRTAFESHESADRFDKHVRLAYSMLTSKAWQDLNHGSRTVFIEMKRRYQGGAKKEITCPYSSVSNLISRGGFVDAIDDLINHGFVEVYFRGWASRQCSIYTLSDKWYHWPNISIEPGKLRRPKYDRVE